MSKTTKGRARPADAPAPACGNEDAGRAPVRITVGGVTTVGPAAALVYGADGALKAVIADPNDGRLGRLPLALTTG